MANEVDTEHEVSPQLAIMQEDSDADKNAGETESPYNEVDSEEVDTDFNFGEINDETSHFSVSVGGGIYVGVTPFFSDMKKIQNMKPSSLLWANIHLDAQAPLTRSYINLNLNDQTLSFDLSNRWETTKTNKTPRWLDEAFLQVSMGSVYFSGGLKKITWGRADALSVLDVINPHDKTHILFPDNPEKMGVPLLQFFAYTPRDIKMEVVFLPMFTPHLLALEGKWESEAMKQVKKYNFAQTKEEIQRIFRSDTEKFKFAHAGVRLSTTLANAHDVGFQYFYGHSKMPIIHADETSAFADYLPTHHIGLDYGTAIGVVNLKLEACANIVGRQKARDSNFEWNVHLASPLTHGLNVNLVFKETIWMYTLKEDSAKVYYSFFRKTKQTETVSLLSISQTILRGAIEWRIALMMGLEDIDFAILPSIHALFGTIIFDAQMGFFTGKDSKGTFSQYHNNNYLRLSFGYEF